MNDIFKDYPQVVNFSGHSHYSLLDERSVHQRDYTSIATQSISYTELESGNVNGTIPPNASATPMGYVMDIHSDRVEIIRVNFSDKFGEEGLVEKQPWILPVPLTKDGFIYTDARVYANAAPVMTAGKGSYRADGARHILSSPQAATTISYTVTSRYGATGRNSCISATSITDLPLCRLM